MNGGAPSHVCWEMVASGWCSLGATRCCPWLVGRMEPLRPGTRVVRGERYFLRPEDIVKVEQVNSGMEVEGYGGSSTRKALHPRDPL